MNRKQRLNADAEDKLGRLLLLILTVSVRATKVLGAQASSPARVEANQLHFINGLI